MNTAASSPAVARLARPSQAKLAQKSSCLAGRRLLAADCRKVSVALGRGASVKCVAADEAKPMVGSDPSKLTVSLPAALNIDDIMARLPHRFPFLLVDRIVEWVPGQYAIGIKNVTVNDNFFPGHFPTRPLMPGVLQVEAMAQVGGLVMLTPEVGGSKDNFFFGGVDACRFRKPVLPGDTLVMKVELVKLNKRFGVAKMKAQAFVGDKLACEAELTMVLGSA